jgi:hypothetical protein
VAERRLGRAIDRRQLVKRIGVGQSSSTRPPAILKAQWAACVHVPERAFEAGFRFGAE